MSPAIFSPVHSPGPAPSLNSSPGGSRRKFRAPGSASQALQGPRPSACTAAGSSLPGPGWAQSLRFQKRSGQRLGPPALSGLLASWLCQSPHLLLYHLLSSTACTLFTQCPGLELWPATRVLSINCPLRPRRSQLQTGQLVEQCSRETGDPWLGLRQSKARGRKHDFPLIVSEPRGQQRLSEALAGRSGGAPVLTGGTRGNPSILHACNIQPRYQSVGSPTSVGASAEPLGMGCPVGGRMDSGRAQGSGLPPELWEPWVSPLP